MEDKIAKPTHHARARRRTSPGLTFVAGAAIAASVTFVVAPGADAPAPGETVVVEDGAMKMTSPTCARDPEVAHALDVDLNKPVSPTLFPWSATALVNDIAVRGDDLMPCDRSQEGVSVAASTPVIALESGVDPTTGDVVLHGGRFVSDKGATVPVVGTVQLASAEGTARYIWIVLPNGHALLPLDAEATPVRRGAHGKGASDVPVWLATNRWPGGAPHRRDLAGQLRHRPVDGGAGIALIASQEVPAVRA